VDIEVVFVILSLAATKMSAGSKPGSDILR